MDLFEVFENFKMSDKLQLCYYIYFLKVDVRHYTFN